MREELTSKAFRALPGSRRTAFETVDRPALWPLPLESYEFAVWKKVRVRMDYHVPIEGHCYSVPHRHAGQELAVRLTARTVECFAGTTRIAAHLRSDEQGGHTTVGEHMPESHRRYAEATVERLLEAADRIGVATAELARRIVATGGHREQSARQLTGVLALGKAYGAERLEAAAARALEIGALRYQSIASILKQALDRQALPEQQTEQAATITHDNLRGAGYYSLGPVCQTPPLPTEIHSPHPLHPDTDHRLTGGPTYVEHTHA